MGEEYRGKVFKSGNSLALRLPKGLGMEEGTEMRLVRETPTSFRAEPVESARKTIDVDRIWGIIPGLKLRDDHNREFEDRPSGWRPPDWDDIA